MRVDLRRRTRLTGSAASKVGVVTAPTPEELSREIARSGARKAQFETLATLMLAVAAGVFIALGAMFASSIGAGSELGLGPTRLLMGDDAIRYGFGLRWAQMGLFETYRAGGGEGGVEHFIHQFGPTLALPWSKLTDVPDLSDELVDTLVAQSDAQSGQYTPRELERIRDRNLVGILKALEANDWAAGRTSPNSATDWPTERDAIRLRR